MARARLRRRVQRSPRLVRRHLSRDRPGPDRGDDREPPHGALMEAVHGGAGGACRAPPARFLEPALVVGRPFRRCAVVLARASAPGGGQGTLRDRFVTARRLTCYRSAATLPSTDGMDTELARPCRR